MQPSCRRLTIWIHVAFINSCWLSRKGFRRFDPSASGRVHTARKSSDRSPSQASQSTGTPVRAQSAANRWLVLEIHGTATASRSPAAIGSALAVPDRVTAIDPRRAIGRGVGDPGSGHSLTKPRTDYRRRCRPLRCLSGRRWGAERRPVPNFEINAAPRLSTRVVTTPLLCGRRVSNPPFNRNAPPVRVSLRRVTRHDFGREKHPRNLHHRASGTAAAVSV